MSLTPKQEKYVRGLVSGMSQREAYRSAYNCARLKPDSMDQLASRLFADLKVRSRYDELVAEAAAESKWDRKRAIDSLMRLKANAERKVELAMSPDAHGDTPEDLPNVASRTALECVEKLNRLCGIADAPEDGDPKVEIVINYA